MITAILGEMQRQLQAYFGTTAVVHWQSVTSPTDTPQIFINLLSAEVSPDATALQTIAQIDLIIVANWTATANGEIATIAESCLQFCHGKKWINGVSRCIAVDYTEDEASSKGVVWSVSLKQGYGLPLIPPHGELFTQATRLENGY